MTQAILTSLGPFATVQLVQKATVVIEVMGNLEKDGLGLLRKQDRTNVFLKELSCSVRADDIHSGLRSRSL